MVMVLYVHGQHPEWCTKEIAFHLAKSWSSVRSCYRRLQVKGLIGPARSTYERRRIVPEIRSYAVRE